MKGYAIQIEDGNHSGDIMDLRIIPERVNGQIVKGLVIGNTLEQNKALILMAHPGDFKFKPTLGIGIGDVLLDESDSLLEKRHQIRQQFALDGLKVSFLDFYKKNQLNIIADYE